MMEVLVSSDLNHVPPFPASIQFQAFKTKFKVELKSLILVVRIQPAKVGLFLLIIHLRNALILLSHHMLCAGKNKYYVTIITTLFRGALVEVLTGPLLSELKRAIDIFRAQNLNCIL